MTTLPASGAAASEATEDAAAHRGRILRAVLWMIGALLSFSTLAVSVRALAGSLNLFEVLSIRSGIGLSIVLALAAARADLRAQLMPHRLLHRAGLHVVRNSVHFGAQYAWVLALTLLPLATVFSLEFTAPAWTALLAVFLLGEHMTASRAGSVVLGFLGVLVILRPGFESFRPAALLVLAAAFGFAIVFVTTKKLTTDVPIFAILFWMHMIQLPMGLAGSDPYFLAKIGGAKILAALGVGIAGTTSHVCLSNAFRAGDAMLVVPLDFLRIPLIAVVGWAFYHEPVDVFVFAGAGIIISGVLWNLRAETRRR